MASLLNVGRGLIENPYEYKFVDLGLPSGLLWADRNLGANAPEEYGLYFAWGETTGYVDASARNAALGLTGGFDNAAYSATGANLISTNLSGSTDAATVALGANYRMTAMDDFPELYNNTDSEWVINYNGTGINGRKFMKKTDHSVFIFVPANGAIVGRTLNRGTSGNYWKSSLISQTTAGSWWFNNRKVNMYDNYYRQSGFCIRAVCQQLNL